MLTAIWVAVAVWVSAPWRSDIDAAIGPLAAWAIPTLLAYLPAGIIGLLCATLLLTRERPPALCAPTGPWAEGEWPAITVILPAHDEEQTIVPALEHIASSSYPGEIHVVLADDGSTDATAERAGAAARRLSLSYRRSEAPERGKHRALNAALSGVVTDLVVTVDADTVLHGQALQYLVARVASSPRGEHVAACAGAVIPQNGTRNLLTRMQRWDYRLAIDGVKRMQAAYEGVLVAQGAFSAYWAEDVRAVGGWPDAIAEDIVLTWSLMRTQGLILYEPLAIAHTVVPVGLRHLFRQRSRWARGMLEALQAHPPPRQPRTPAKVVTGIDYLIPFLDFGYVFLWLPGAALFAAGNPLLFSWWSLLVFPLTLAVYGLVMRRQRRGVFRPLGIRLKRDVTGFVLYVIVYQALVSAASLVGYANHTVRARRRWRH